MIRFRTMLLAVAALGALALSQSGRSQTDTPKTPVEIEIDG